MVAGERDASVRNPRDPRPRTVQPRQDLPRPHVGRAVVDDHDLRGRPRLGQRAIDGFFDGPAEVVTGDDDADRRR